MLYASHSTLSTTPVYLSEPYTWDWLVGLIPN